MIGSVQGDKAARGQRWLLSAEEEEGRTKSDGERNETSTLDLETQTLFPSLSSFHPFSHRFPVRTQKTHTEKHTGTLQKGRSKERSKETKKAPRLCYFFYRCRLPPCLRCDRGAPPSTSAAAAPAPCCCPSPPPSISNLSSSSPRAEISELVISVRHSGQVACRSSQSPTQFEWKRWPQGRAITFSAELFFGFWFFGFCFFGKK